VDVHAGIDNIIKAMQLGETPRPRMEIRFDVKDFHDWNIVVCDDFKFSLTRTAGGNQHRLEKLGTCTSADNRLNGWFKFIFSYC